MIVTALKKQKVNQDIQIRKILITLFFFLLVGLWEIGGGYLVWLWLREDMSWILGAIGGFILFLYGIVPTFQPSYFHRIYAAYGGIFIISSIAWGMIVDEKKPDRFEIIGSLVAVCGAIIIFYTPR
jgi:small multidrug resistance family-3 protein